jgi:hypothetical protein
LPTGRWNIPLEFWFLMQLEDAYAGLMSFMTASMGNNRHGEAAPAATDRVQMG